MTVLGWALSALSLGWLAAGCGGASPPPAAVSKVVAAEPAATAAVAQQKPAAPAVMPRAPEAGPPLASLTYDPKGRRDPFTPIPAAVEKSSGLDVSTTRLVGIIQGQQLRALVEAPDGLGYILKPGDVLGNGRMTDITANSVTFAITGRAGQRETSLTLKLVKE